MKDKSNNSFHDSVAPLAEFLNVDTYAPLSEWKRVVFFARGRERVLREEARKLQTEIRDDVQKILEPPKPTGATDPRVTPRRFWLSRLADKIERMRFVPGRLVEPWPNPQIVIPGGIRGVLEIRGERFVVQEATSWKTSRDYFYWLLDVALRTGELSQLRKCRSCLKYFITTKRKQQCCSKKCNADFQNRRRLESGKFTELRRTKRKLTIAQARRLKREGKSTHEIMERTGLTERMLRREGIF